jgi:predicted amidohydrolase
MARHVTLAAAQPLRRREHEPPMTVEENLSQAAELIDRAPAGTDVICFPELFSVASIEREKSRPYEDNCKHTPQFLEALSRKAAARDCCLVLGLPWNNRNCAFFLDRKGSEAGRYDKCQLTYGERDKGLDDGKDNPVIEMDFGRVGALICYDLYFPEHARVLALNGAEVLFHPTRINNAPTEKAFEALCIARAAENVCWFVSSSFCAVPPFNYSGWMARSFVVDPYGMIRAEAGKEPGICAATVDLDMRERRPQGFLWQTFRRLRRPDLYGRLTEP